MKVGTHGWAEGSIYIFEDTCNQYTHGADLRQSVETPIAGTVLYPAGTTPALGAARFSHPMSVSVSRRRTLEATLLHLREGPGANVTVLNFVPATNPEGGVTRGSSVQEEALCRCTTLYPTLNTPYLQREF